MKGRDRKAEMGRSFLSASMMRGGERREVCTRKGRQLAPWPLTYGIKAMAMSESEVPLWKSFRGVKITQVCTGIQPVQ